MKFILLAGLIFVMAGCAAAEVERNRPTRSVPRSVPIETFPYEAPDERPTRQNPRQNTGEAREIPREETSRSDSPVAFGRFETEFDAKDIARGVNIMLAARAIDNTIVAPGEIFSFNTAIGSTTAERGYKKSIIFVDGKKSEGYGGGVCQVSTTLCNAANLAGMTLVERHDHSRPVAYVKDGLQAATSHNGGLDFKFRNDTPYPAIIRANAENGRISVSVGRV